MKMKMAEEKQCKDLVIEIIRFLSIGINLIKTIWIQMLTMLKSPSKRSFIFVNLLSILFFVFMKAKS